MLRHKSGPAAKCQTELSSITALVEGCKLLPRPFVFLAVDDDGVSVPRLRLESVQNHLGHEVVLAPGLHHSGDFSTGYRWESVGLHLHDGGCGRAQPDGCVVTTYVADHRPMYRCFAVLLEQALDQRPLVDRVQPVMRATNDAADRQAKFQRLGDTRLGGVHLAKRALRHGEHVLRLGVPRQFCLHESEKLHGRHRLAGADQVQCILVDALILLKVRLVLGEGHRCRKRHCRDNEPSYCRSHATEQCA